jgi:hypothetical protein
MKYAMKNDPVQLLFYRVIVLVGIIPHPIDTDVYFRIYCLIFCCGKIKSDDIGVKIMSQKLPIDRQQVFIRTEDILQPSQFLTFLFDYRDQEFFEPGPVFQRDPGWKIEPDDGNSHNFTTPR